MDQSNRLVRPEPGSPGTFWKHYCTEDGPGGWQVKAFYDPDLAPEHHSWRVALIKRSSTYYSFAARTKESAMDTVHVMLDAIDMGILLHADNVLGVVDVVRDAVREMRINQ